MRRCSAAHFSLPVSRSSIHTGYKRAYTLPKHQRPAPASRTLLRINSVSKGRFRSTMSNRDNRPWRIVPVPVNSDNFAYLLISNAHGVCAAVDPAEPEKVLAAAKAENVSIVSILATHHHGDHCAGNAELVRSISESKDIVIPVYGGDGRVEAVSHLVREGDEFLVGDVALMVREVPCHTTGHVLFAVGRDVGPEAGRSAAENPGAIFTGDTLFVGGCGRFFEGSPEQMHHALCEVIAPMPTDTEVYPGHEYTVKNLEFAMSVDGQNSAVREKLNWAREQVGQGAYTVPSTVGEERQFNPFMRCAELAGSLGVNTAVEAMRELRRRKDAF